MDRNPVLSYLHTLAVEDASEIDEVVTLNENQILEDAIHTFGKHGILSAPVVNDDGSLVGMIDMLDIANYIVKTSPSDEQIEANEAQTLARAGRVIALKEIKGVMETSGRDPLVPLNHNSPLSMAVGVFSFGVHRVPVVSCDDECLIGFVSQTDVLRMLSEEIYRGKLKHMGEKTLQELGVGQAGILSANVNDQVIDVVRLLDSRSVSAVALLNEENQLVGNFSITDLRGLWDELWPTFNLSVGKYLERHHPSSLEVRMFQSDQTTLAEVIQVMLDHHQHRVWVQDDEGVPSGVVSMTDLMSLFQDYELEV